jgi:hypothetical protein
LALNGLLTTARKSVRLSTAQVERCWKLGVQLLTKVNKEPRVELMVFSSELPSTSISYHLSVLNAKLDEVAERGGVAPSSCVDLETCLAALPWRERRRLTLLLESVRVHANSPGLQDAVRLMQRLAADVWAEEPPPDMGRYQPAAYHE